MSGARGAHGKLTVREISRRASIAALLEVSAPKPGNVSRHHDFADTRFDDFLISAVAIGDAIGAAGRSGVGRAIARAVIETRRWVRANTNLGIILLFAPLAAAAARPGGTLRERTAAVLAGLTVVDAEEAYGAIRAAAPGGLGTVAEQDVGETPSVTLRAAMALAADRDAIAREYGTDFATTFEMTAPALRRARATLGWSEAITEAYLTVLAAHADTLIARKRGAETAARVSREAATVLESGAAGTATRAAAVTRFDRALREDGNALNPGTTADLIAAGIFVLLLEDGPTATE